MIQNNAYMYVFKEISPLTIRPEMKKGTMCEGTMGADHVCTSALTFLGLLGTSLPTPWDRRVGQSF